MENEVVLTVREVIVCVMAIPFYYSIYKLITKGIDFIIDMVNKRKNKIKEEKTENV